jgi:hypothetical protein
VIRRIHTANALGRPGSLVVREAYVSDGSQRDVGPAVSASTQTLPAAGIS